MSTVRPRGTGRGRKKQEGSQTAVDITVNRHHGWQFLLGAGLKQFPTSGRQSFLWNKPEETIQSINRAENVADFFFMKTSHVGLNNRYKCVC